MLKMLATTEPDLRCNVVGVEGRNDTRKRK